MKIFPKKTIFRRRVRNALTGVLTGGLYWNLLLILLCCILCLIIVYDVMCAPIQDYRYSPLIKPTNRLLAPMPLDNRLIDLENFRFLADHKCNDTRFLLVVVPSAPRNINNRNAIRRTWGQRVYVLFLLGETEQNPHLLYEENKINGDILQGAFRDSYRNMTYKHVMALKWISARCPRLKYVVKVDDDVYVNVHTLLQWLVGLSPYGSNDLIACQMEMNRVVYRIPTVKWRVTLEEYRDNYYPEFCRGWAIIYSTDVVQTLYIQSLKEKFFWVDDVFVTGIMAKHTNKRITRLHTLAISDMRKSLEISSGKDNDSFIFLLTTPNKFYRLEEKFEGT